MNCFFCVSCIYVERSFDTFYSSHYIVTVIGCIHTARYLTDALVRWFIWRTVNFVKMNNIVCGSR